MLGFLCKHSHTGHIPQLHLDRKHSQMLQKFLTVYQREITLEQSKFISSNYNYSTQSTSCDVRGCFCAIGFQFSFNRPHCWFSLQVTMSVRDDIFFNLWNFGLWPKLLTPSPYFEQPKVKKVNEDKKKIHFQIWLGPLLSF